MLRNKALNNITSIVIFDYIGFKFEKLNFYFVKVGF